MSQPWILSAFDRWGAAVLLAAAALAYGFFVDIPYGATTAHLRKETSERRQFVAEAEKLVLQTERIEREAREASAFVESWREATPDTAAVGTFYGELDHAVRRAGVDVTRFEPQPAVALATIEQRPITLAFEGRHADVAAALVNLESLPATIWVRDVTVTPARERAGFVQFESKVIVFADKADNSD